MITDTEKDTAADHALTVALVLVWVAIAAAVVSIAAAFMGRLAVVDPAAGVAQLATVCAFAALVVHEVLAGREKR